MKVGTVETFEAKKRQRRVGSRSGFGSNGGNQNNGGGGGGGNDGGNNRSDGYIEEQENYPSNKFRIGMWFLLLVVLMTFGGSGLDDDRNSVQRLSACLRAFRVSGRWAR